MPALSADQHRTVRELCADYLIVKGYSREYAELLRRGDGQTTKLRWTGYAHNAALLTTGSVFLISLGWVPAVVHQRTRRGRLGAGLCPRCRYQLAGLPSGICPECGELLRA